MKPDNTGKRQWFPLLIAMMALIISFPPESARANGVATEWTGEGDGLNWSDDSNWSTGIVPQSGEDVLITGVPGATVSYDITASSLNSLTIGNSSTLNHDSFTLPITGNLVLGESAGSTGAYDLNGGDLTVGGAATIGNAGTGIFNQNDGTHLIGTYDEDGNIVGGGNLILGEMAGSVGEYYLSSGNLNVGGNSIIGSGGNGTFTQNFGYHTVGAYDAESNLYGGNLILGNSTGSTGTYNLQNGTLTVYGNTVIGQDGAGTFNQDAEEGSLHQVSGNLYIARNSGSTGTYNLYGGDLYVSGNTIVGEYGTGAFMQSGGTHTVATDLNLAQVAGSKGSYEISGTGILDIGRDMYMGQDGVGTFTQSGGNVKVAGNLFVGVQPTASGSSYTLSGGKLESGSLHVGIYGANAAFTQSGGTNTTGVLQTYNKGTYDLKDGTLTVANVIINAGTFNYSGGTLGAAPITNYGTVNLSGSGTRTINGDVNNYGTIKVTGTTVNFTGTLFNYGSYKSDPSTTNAATIIIGSAGYLVGGAGDQWILSNDFENKSTQNTLWSTGASYLGFVDGVNGDDKLHNLYLPGTDAAGYTNNFAWGEVNIASGNSLVLFDGNTGNAGTALYVGKILGVIIDNGEATNITGVDGYKIFYNPSLAGNEYLGGLTYALNGGGSLSPVPIPGSLILFGSGLLGLVGIGRKRRKS